MQITKEQLQQSLNQYLSTPGLLFVAGQGAMGFANQLITELTMVPDHKPTVESEAK